MAVVVFPLLGQKADLILLDGTVVTMEASRPRAQAVAVSGDRVLAVGTNDDMKKFRDESTRIMHLDNALVIPGFIDSHGHFMGLGESRLILDLRNAQNWRDIVDIVAAAAEKAKPGVWIQGRGWHQEKWKQPPVPAIDGLPLHHSLSKVSPNNPVLLAHASGHACFVNAKAMAVAGIDGKTQPPAGGQIVKDKSGNPIGVFRENAMHPLYAALEQYKARRTPKQVKKDDREIFDAAQKACLQNGITSFTDAGSSFETIDLYKQLAKEKLLAVRLNVMVSANNQRLKEKIADYKVLPSGGDYLGVRAVKRLMDGALGSHGAWLLKPYLSLPQSTGLNTETVAYMKETAAIAAKHGFQLCTHAIGDRANREVLNVYEEAFNANPHKKDLRWRIEHAQHLNPVDIPRFAKLSVIAAMQGIHCTSDGPWVPKRLGDKRTEEGAYVWRKLMDSGALICNGTDVPVESVDPIACYYASVTRKMKNGNVFYGKQKMSREEALRSYTINGAYASFNEKRTGSLKPGKLADITILSQNILTIPADDIPNTRVLYTIVGGKVRYTGAKK
ncbi:MAG: amidohydrolase [bacterium]|nr:amidohydrolase [bacterium]